MNKWVLALIVALAFFLRIPLIHSFPQGFTPDEASFGYDAYSLLHTGKDQWGHTLPIVLESFGDYKAPLYSYLTIPFVGIGDLNVFSTRLPNALLGALTVVLVYFLVLELFKDKDNNRQIAVASSFLLAVSPWHVMMSRGAFEANLTTYLMPLAVLLFIKGLNKHRLLILSSIIFGLNLFSYHSAKFVTPFIFISLIIFWRERFFTVQRRFVFMFVSIFTVFLVLTAMSFGQGAGARVSDISVFAGAMEEAAGPRLEMINSGKPVYLAKMVHNKYVVAGNKFINNYSTYYSPRFLFTSGPNEATYGMIPGIGVLYYVELIFLFSFAIWFIKNPRSKEVWLVVFWVLIAAVPAALTQGIGYSANRAVVMIPAITIISAIGFESASIYISRKLSTKPKYVYVVFVTVVLIQTIYISKRYLTPNTILAKSMLYGRIEAVNNNVGEDIIISRSLSEPQIYVAFVNKWDPKSYQSNSINWKVYKDRKLKFLDQLDPYHLGNYTFTSLEGKEAQVFRGYTVVGKPEEFPIETIPTKVIYHPGGEEALFIVEYE